MGIILEFFGRLYRNFNGILREIYSILVSCQKRLFHGIKAIFHPSKPRKSAGPLLPLENTTPKPRDVSYLKRLFDRIKAIFHPSNQNPTPKPSDVSCLKRLFHWIKSLFHPSKPRKSAGPLLPLENPTPKPSDHPLLEQSLLISDSDTDPQCQNVHVSSSENENSSYTEQVATKSTGELCEESSETKDFVTISIPFVTSSQVLDSCNTSAIADTDSAVITQENAPRETVFSYDETHQNQENYQSEVKKIVDSATISIPGFSTTSSADTIPAAAIQEIKVSQKNETYTEHEETKTGQRSEVKKVIESTKIVVETRRWIKHYSSSHRILLVGEGDFSFSRSLAVAFVNASKMIATSLDSQGFLKKNYAMAPFNIKELKKRGCMVMHGIDATTIATHKLLGHRSFNRVIYNFPFAGFFKESRENSLRRHRRLVSLFLKNAKELIEEDDEIHISHKTNGYHREWNLVSMASSHGLRLVEEVEFDLSDYPGYNTKRGFGGDENFNCYPSSTFKFGLKP